MKKLLLVLTMLAALFSSICGQQSDFDTRQTFFGVGLGNRQRGAVFGGIRQGKIGFQLGLFNNLDIDPFTLVDGFPPSDTTFLGQYRTQIGGGLDILFFPGEEQRSLYVGLGIYQQTYTLVGRSNLTGGLYDIGSRYVYEGALSLGFMGRADGGQTIGFGWHTHLGWNLSFVIPSRN